MLVADLQNNLPIAEVGGKGYSLTILGERDLNVPKGFVITSEAFFEYLKRNSLTEKTERLCSEINENNFKEKSKEIRNLILNGEIPEEIAMQIKKSLKKLGVQYVSVRSSAASEDSLKASFAGLYDTFLNVKVDPSLILGKVKKCWMSLFNERAVTYRITKRIPHLEGMAVVIQKMIPAEISGITLTVHPTDKRNLLVEASFGLGDIIAGGKVDPDDYTVDRKTLEIVEKKIGKKNKKNVVEITGIKVFEVERELAEKQVLSDYKIKEIAEACLKVEKIFHYPQDIEWSLYDERLWFLQSRTMTGLIT